MSDDDARWLEGLAGRDPSVPEAELLRERILSRSVDPSEAVPPRDPEREAALVERARREGLIPAKSGFWDARRVVATLAVAASLALAFVLFPRAPREPDPTRGAPTGIVRLESEDPAGLQRRIVAELGDAGVQATAYERLGRFGVDADLPAPVPPEVVEVLRRHGVPVPPDGMLTFEIAPRASR